MLGILLVAKPAGCTSHDVVNRVRRKFSTRRVGHAGTLDPQATGLLVVAVGPATRFLQYLPLEPKEYIGRIQFGRETDSYDGEGSTVKESLVPSNLMELFEAARPNFLNLIEQYPPMFSAVKVDGKPLYKYARQGQELERKPRTVHIQAYDVLASGPDWIDCRIVCSGGTYIRSLAHDMGQSIGCGAYLSSLIRNRVGHFSLGMAKEIDLLDPSDLLPLSEAISHVPHILLDDREAQGVREGRPFMLAQPPTEPVVAFLDSMKRVMGMGRVHGNMVQPECVIPAEMMPSMFVS